MFDHDNSILVKMKKSEFYPRNPLNPMNRGSPYSVLKLFEEP